MHKDSIKNRIYEKRILTNINRLNYESPIKNNILNRNPIMPKRNRESPVYVKALRESPKPIKLLKVNPLNEIKKNPLMKNSWYSSKCI